MKKQTVLLNRSKQLRDLKIKYKYQEKNIQELNSEICQLKSMTTEALDFVDRTENEKKNRISKYFDFDQNKIAKQTEESSAT